MSPEILKRQSHNYKSDLWSLGIIFYFILFRDFPFKSKFQILEEIEKATLPSFQLKKHLKQKWQKDRATDDICDLFKQIFVINPQLRISFEKLYSL